MSGDSTANTLNQWAVFSSALRQHTTKPARAVYRGCEEEVNVYKPKSMTTPRIIMNAFNQQRGEIDFLYRRLWSDIYRWYDKYGDSEVKVLHLHLLRTYYDPARFAGDIGIERLKFLTELQEIVDKRSLYGMSEMS